MVIDLTSQLTSMLTSGCMQVEVRVLAVLQIALVACVIAVPAPLGSEVEMLQGNALISPS